MQERLHRLLERLLLHHEANETWRQISDQLPYPLDHETAAAVDAAVQHYVEPWGQFEESGVVQDWVTAAYEAEGKQALPFWSSCVRDGSKPPWGFVAPTEEEVRRLFSDEACFQQWLAGEDYQFGLADVTDSEFLGRCEAVEAAVRGLVQGGQVEQLSVVELESVPMAFLRTAPLLDGDWVDAYVIKLAEWGGLLRRKGYIFKSKDDNSPFAWDRIEKDTEEGLVEVDQQTLESHRDAVRQKLVSFPGRTKEIDGRTYFHFEDYARWKGRTAKGRLLRMGGILTTSWNAWVVSQPNGASLAGVPIGRLECWAHGYGHTVHDREEATRLNEARNALLQGQRARTLHNLDGEPGLFVRKGKLTGRTFVEETARWREEALAFGSQVCSLRTTLSKVSERYFDGTPVILSQESAQLEALAAMWDDLLEQFNDFIISEFEQVPEGPDVDRLDPAALSAEGGVQALEQAAYLVDSAKAMALKDMRDDEAAIALMVRWED